MPTSSGWFVSDLPWTLAIGLVVAAIVLLATKDAKRWSEGIMIATLAGGLATCRSLVAFRYPKVMHRGPHPPRHLSRWQGFEEAPGDRTAVRLIECRYCIDQPARDLQPGGDILTGVIDLRPGRRGLDLGTPGPSPMFLTQEISEDRTEPCPRGSALLGPTSENQQGVLDRILGLGRISNEPPSQVL